MRSSLGEGLIARRVVESGASAVELGLEAPELPGEGRT